MKLTSQQLAQLDRISEILKNMGCTYVVETPDGHKFTNVKAKPKRATPIREKLRQHNVGRGEITDYLKKALNGTKVGQVAQIPLGPYTFLGRDLSGYISGYCSRHFGNGSYSSTWDKESQSFLVHIHGGI